MSNYHTPVLLHECIDALQLKQGGIYVDVTFGGGGHSKEILKRMHKTARLIAFDQDLDAQKNKIDDERFLFIHSNFRYIKNYLRYYGINKVDGILADLGISSFHIDAKERGFSFQSNAFLDMRMNKNKKKTAADIINNYDEQDLINLFRNFGELKNAGALTKKIIEARSSVKIEKIDEFINIIKDKIPKNRENKYLAKVFQALRIEVNDEMSALEDFLSATGDLLKSGGRLVVMSYHSLEDRYVKNYIRTGNCQGKVEKDIYGNYEQIFKPVNKKPIVPGNDEIEKNPRARSAKLRIAEKL